MMTQKRTTRKATKRAPARRERRPKAPTALFLETSAQILRITGSREMKRGIKELVDNSDKVGTSAAVKEEFEEVLIRFYKAVAVAAGMLPHPSRPQPFEDMWEEVAGLMPYVYPGGPSLFPHLTKMMNARFGGQSVTPMEVQHEFDGLEQAAREQFIGKDNLEDKSSCGVWRGHGSCSYCNPEPAPTCRLKEICVTQREDFLATVTTLANANREESPWLKANLERIHAAEGKALLEIVGSNPGAFGDIIIFWEAPDVGTILTRDRTFSILQRAHRKKLKVYMVRLPRNKSGGWCSVRFEQASVDVSGDLIDYNAKGARVRAPLSPLKKGARVVINAAEFTPDRRGKVAYLDEKKESVFALRLPFNLKKV